MKLIAGLGNPGIKFQNTRHNVGFFIVDSFLSKNKYQILKKTPYEQIYQINFDNHKALIVKPQNYMNLSGKVIKEILQKYHIQIENTLVIIDDIYLQEGKLKLKLQGGHGGHNGIRNIIDCCCTNKFKRLKIGVSYDSNIALDKYLLSSMNLESKNNVFKEMRTIHKIIKNFIQDIDFANLMN